MAPHTDDFEVLNHLTRDPATRDIPVIMLTAKASDADVYAGWHPGVDCYLTKPFNPKERIRFVQRIFASQLHQAQEPDGGRRIVL